MTTAQVPHDEISVAVIGAKVDQLGKSLDELKLTLSTSNLLYVPRAEWELRNKLVDERHERMERDQAQRRAPWWSALAVILAAVALGWTILGPVITR